MYRIFHAYSGKWLANGVIWGPYSEAESYDTFHVANAVLDSVAHAAPRPYGPAALKVMHCASDQHALDVALANRIEHHQPGKHRPPYEDYNHSVE